jgi:phosphoglycolate phosphatase
VLSSNSEANIRKCLAANGVEQHFAFVIGHPQLFGKARALRRIRRREKIDREHIVYVGDETRDVEAAQRAGVGAAAVGWGYHTPELLARMNPTVLVREPHELVQLANGAA